MFVAGRQPHQHSQFLFNAISGLAGVFKLVLTTYYGAISLVPSSSKAQWAIVLHPCFWNRSRDRTSTSGPIAMPNAAYASYQEVERHKGDMATSQRGGWWRTQDGGGGGGSAPCMAPCPPFRTCGWQGCVSVFLLRLCALALGPFISLA